MFATDFQIVLPEVILAAYAMLALLFAVYTGKDAVAGLLTWVTAGLFVLLALWIGAGGDGARTAFGGMVNDDPFSRFAKVVILVSAAAVLAMSADYMARRGLLRFEYPVLIALAVTGMMVMVSAGDLLSLYVGIELQSLSLYVIAALRRDSVKSTEAGLKYFVLGALSSGMLLYGASLTYGFAGTTQFAGILSTLEHGAPLGLTFGLVFILAALSFKVSAAPFHMWTPDVYEGSPTPVTAFLSVASKAASFALLLRFGLAVFPPTLFLDGQQVQSYWTNMAAVLAVATMTVGNLLALAQKNIKRLLAYSSIAQAGYVLIGVAALASPNAQQDAVTSIIFYLAMYTFTNMLAFGIVILFANATGSENISEMAGMSRRSPWLALGMTVALLSLAGVPPAAGFFGKFFLFQSAVEADLTWLALVGVLWSIVALYYYLVVIKIMYVDHGQNEDQPIAVQRSTVWTLGLTAIVVILLGSFAVQPIYQLAVQGAASLFGAG